MIKKNKKKIVWLLIVLVLIAGGVLYLLNLPKTKEKIMLEETLKDKKENLKAVLIIAFRGFQDQEYANTKDSLEKNGIEVITASSSKGEAEGKFGEKIKIEKTIEEINVDDFNAIVFIGGPGAQEYIDNKTAHKIAKEATEKGKILAAICIAPEILAKAGVLTDKKATVWSSSIDLEPIKLLEENKAIYSEEDVVVDGKIITANGPMAAKKFGEKIVETLISQMK